MTKRRKKRSGGSMVVRRESLQRRFQAQETRSRLALQQRWYSLQVPRCCLLLLQHLRSLQPLQRNSACLLMERMMITTESNKSSEESDGELEGRGCRLFELEGLMAVFRSVACGKCGKKSLEYREDFQKCLGLYTAPYLIFKSCSWQLSIPFTTFGGSKVFKVNRKAVFANKCAGGSSASLQMRLGCLICLYQYQRMHTSYTSYKLRNLPSYMRKKACVEQGRSFVQIMVLKEMRL